VVGLVVAYGVSDLNGDGFDDVAIRCREVDQDEQSKKHLTDTTALYSLKEGKFVPDILTNKDQRLKIWSNLCRNSSGNRLCRDIENSKASRGSVSSTP
jgi:hypothetical protein